MRTIDATEAEQRLDNLLDEVEFGETIVITRRGRPVARLVPEIDRAPATPDEVIAAIRAFRARMPRLSYDEVRSSLHEGHRY